ncbi:leucyl aminopeptidase family protein [Formicincola oecophyllae]|nr:leucyl aminopeptidase family protein [Formicincola oecophyllae]
MQSPSNQLAPSLPLVEAVLRQAASLPLVGLDGDPGTMVGTLILVPAQPDGAAPTAWEVACGASLGYARQLGLAGVAGDFLLLPTLPPLSGSEDQVKETQPRLPQAPVALYCYQPGAGPDEFGALAQKLPPGPWRLEAPFTEGEEDEGRESNEGAAAPARLMADALLGFCLGSPSCTLKGHDLAQLRAREGDAGPAAPVHKRACLVTPPPHVVPEVMLAEVRATARAMRLGRALINVPANLLGPAELARAAATLLADQGAKVTLVEGAMVAADYPCLAAVGAGSQRGPVVVKASWGHPEAPLVALCGKGVCFDTGGYNLKPGGAMARMKKDMGGAAFMLATALLLVETVPNTAQGVRFELRLGCVENSLGASAMVPGDVLATRSGLTVEVGNTDAEGRLVLCDLLSDVAALKPDLIVDGATLTGAARAALGPDLPALFANSESHAQALLKAGHACRDPLWRLPLWQPYGKWLKSRLADINNCASVPMAGAVTAALFLERFIPPGQPWLHIDTYAWRDDPAPAHPHGGDLPGLRALHRFLAQPANWRGGVTEI